MHNMAQESPLEIDDVVLVTDLASNAGRSNPHPALGRITGFMDKDHGQAIIKYSNGTVNRPIANIVRIVKRSEQISTKGLCFDPQVEADDEIQGALEE